MLPEKAKTYYYLCGVNDYRYIKVVGHSNFHTISKYQWK